jgi:hypothetical protein
MKFIQAMPSHVDLIIEMATISVDMEALDVSITAASMMPIDPSKDDMEEIIRQMQIITDYLTAAKKGLGMSNGIKNQEMRAKHKSQIMSNMNRIRAKHKRVERMFDEWWENHRAGSEQQRSPVDQVTPGADTVTGRADDTRVA